MQNKSSLSKAIEEHDKIDFRQDKIIQEYLKQKHDRESYSDEDEEYSENEALILKKNEKYASKRLYRRIIRICDAAQFKSIIDDDESINEQSTINDIIDKPPFEHEFGNEINSVTFKNYLNLCIDKIERYWKKAHVDYIKKFIIDLNNTNYFSFLYFTQEPICSLKKDLLLHLFSEIPENDKQNILYQMLKYNYFYYEEFEKIKINTPGKKDYIFNKQELKTYLKSQCIIELYQKIIEKLQNKKVDNQEMEIIIDKILENQRIYFIRMPKNITGYTIYDGTIFINRNFYDEASASNNSENGDNIKGNFASLLIVMLREILVGINRKYENNCFYVRSEKIYFRDNYFIKEASAKIFENLLLGEQVINKNYPFESFANFDNSKGFIFLTDKQNYINLKFKEFNQKFEENLRYKRTIIFSVIYNKNKEKKVEGNKIEENLNNKENKIEGNLGNTKNKSEKSISNKENKIEENSDNKNNKSTENKKANNIKRGQKKENYFNNITNSDEKKDKEEPMINRMNDDDYDITITDESFE